MNKNDLDRLRHMLDAAKEAQSFIQGRTHTELESNRMLALSLTKLIEIIGEAAANITKDGQEQMPQIPWPVIVAMRNRLIHGYFAIDFDRVWDTVTHDLPPLIIELEKILSSSES